MSDPPDLARVVHAQTLARGAQGPVERWQVPEVGAAARPRAVPATVRHLEGLEAQAREEGFARGLSEGRKAAEDELAGKVRMLDGLIRALAAPLEDVDAEVEAELAQLAMAVARQLVRRELRTSPAEVIGAVRQALRALPAHARKVKVSVHPEDAALIRAHLGLGAGEHAWDLVEDSMIGRGGCLVSSEHSRVDARVESRLAAIAAAVLGGERTDDAPPGPAAQTGEPGESA